MQIIQIFFAGTAGAFLLLTYASRSRTISFLAGGSGTYANFPNSKTPWVIRVHQLENNYIVDPVGSFSDFKIYKLQT